MCRSVFWCLTLLSLASLSRAADAPAIPLGELPLLFADDAGIASQSQLTRTIHPARTRPSPVLEPTTAWEGGRLYVYGSVYQDLKTGGLRLWYNSALVGKDLQHAPALREGGLNLVLYATSTDGLSWTRPSLRLYEFDNSRENNIVYDYHSPSVLYDPLEKDPSKRYKMLGVSKPKRGYYAAYSPDGLHWRDEPNNPVLDSSDTCTLTQHPTTGEYLAYHKRPATIRNLPRRVVWLARSTDFQTWSKPELVFAPDEADDAWAEKPDQRMEVYNMSVYPHAAGFLGLPTMFKVLQRREKSELTPGQSPVDGPIDVQLATSGDGVHWQRTTPRINVIARGETGAYDGGTILGVTSTCVHVGDVTWAYYTAINTGHGGPIPPKRLTIGRAEWRRHGFASLDAGPRGGRLETRPLQLARNALVVNADASRGELRVGLLETSGKPIPGYELDKCEPLARNETRWTPKWNGDFTAPTDRPVRVVIEGRDAQIYSLSAAK